MQSWSLLDADQPAPGLGRGGYRRLHGYCLVHAHCALLVFKSTCMRLWSLAMYGCPGNRVYYLLINAATGQLVGNS